MCDPHSGNGSRGDQNRRINIINLDYLRAEVATDARHRHMRLPRRFSPRMYESAAYVNRKMIDYSIHSPLFIYCAFHLIGSQPDSSDACMRRLCGMSISPRKFRSQ